MHFAQIVPIESATTIAAGPIALFASGLALDLGHLARHFAEAFVCRGPQLNKVEGTAIAKENGSRGIHKDLPRKPNSMLAYKIERALAT